MPFMRATPITLRHTAPGIGHVEQPEQQAEGSSPFILGQTQQQLEATLRCVIAPQHPARPITQIRPRDGDRVIELSSKWMGLGGDVSQLAQHRCFLGTRQSAEPGHCGAPGQQALGNEIQLQVNRSH